MAGPDTLQFTDADFDETVLAADQPVLVDFWAEWCGPCHQMAPILEALAQEYSGRIKFVKLDTEENFDISDRYGVRSLPTLLLFKDGQQVDRIFGARPKADLARNLEKALA